MGLAQSLGAAEPFRPMLAEMEDYLARQPKPELAQLNDPFAERLVALSKQLGSAVRSELAVAAVRGRAKAAPGRSRIPLPLQSGPDGLG